VHYTVEPLFKLTKELYKNINGWIFQKSFPESKVEYNPKIVFSSFSEDDEFGIEVENAIQRIKDYIKEKIIY
jgi:FPC/CPF motif-containing protein YcgG